MSKGWQVHKGTAIHLPMDNIDTDQIIPARFMSQPRSDGYEHFLFHDIRRNSDGLPVHKFPLNRFPDASILVCGHGFGTGSSREAAAYALIDAGIRVVISTGFGDIFAANAVNNGLLPAIVSIDDKFTLMHAMKNNAMKCVIDLERGDIAFSSGRIGFTIDKTWREKLINGWDDIDLTMAYQDSILSFGASRKHHYAWSWPVKQ